MRFSLVLAVGLVLLGLFPAAAQDAALSDEILFLTFVPNVQFSPAYVGIEKGYFAEGGINLTIEHGDEPVGVDLIAAGERRFGLISGEEVIKARANGRPVVYIYEWFQRYPVGIVTAEGRGIERVTDLAGRKVGIPGRFGASYNGLIALLSANGMTEQDILLEPIGFNAPEVFCAGRVEASVVYVNNEPLQIQARADAGQCGDVKQVKVFPVAEAVDLVSNGLITNEAMLANDPERVQAMATGFDQAMRHIIRNPADTYLLASRYVENLPQPAIISQMALWLETTGEAAESEPPAEISDLLNKLRAAETASGNDSQADARQIRAALRRALAEIATQAAPPEDVLQFLVLLRTIDLWDADRLGYTDPASWEATQSVLLNMGFIREPIDLEAAFTNAFVPEAIGE